MMIMATLDPRPRYLHSGTRRHIARPDHPLGLVPTDIAFCGAHARPADNEEEGAELKTCKRCSLGWVAYQDRLARERDDLLEEAAYAALEDLDREA